MKHDNYDASETIQLTRLGEDEFRLLYEAEGWEFTGTHEEVVAELSDHMELKRIQNNY